MKCKELSYIFMLIIIIFCFNSCDILRCSVFEVTTWSPGNGYHNEPEDILVSLSFSREPDRTSVERHFSLTGNGSRIKGTFLWEGKKMIFAPLSALEKNVDYEINLSAEAHDNKGLSMDYVFERSFTTRPGNERPILLSCYPSMYEEIVNTRTEVKLDFSIPVPVNTLYDNVSFNPSMTGFWRMENGGKTAVFMPSEPWLVNKRYEIHFPTALSDNNNVNTGKEFLSVFTVGTDHEEPLLLYADRITKNGNRVILEPDTSGYIYAADPFIESCNWEKEDRLLLVFSKPVDVISVKNCLNVEGASGLTMETESVYKTELVFYFDTKPVFESRFVIRLKPGVKDSAGNESTQEYVYRIFANGRFSKPPKLEGIRMPMAPGSNTDKKPVFFGKDSLFEYIPITESAENYPSDTIVDTWLELYFITADEASIDKFSLMELFRIETSNNVITFSPKKIKTSGFSIAAPQAGLENLERIEITGSLTNSVNFGIINFQIASGLRDSLDNKNESLQRISVIK